ncbi:MAG: 30S ribosomal protein S4 [Candidatus Lokiarchaeota archaeon]|nr:30S ribosomal protein S4 [Candidatus Lokiarchaeota archaeon]
MGDPRRQKKKFKKPKHPFQRERMREELEILGKYGLRNKREYWKSRTKLGRWREIARHSRTLPKNRAIEVQQTLLAKLNRLGILGPESTFEDILHLNIEDVLKRRLQTLVYEKGLANTIYQARQLIVHKHIQVGAKRIDSPSYIVKNEEQDFIQFAPNSSFTSKK